MTYYARAIINIEEKTIHMLDENIYSLQDRKEIEKQAAENIVTIAEDMLSIEFAEDGDYSYQEILNMMIKIGIAMDGGVFGQNSIAIFSTLNDDARMDIVYDLCKKILKKYKCNNPPEQFKWISIEL
jgi:hypothetical protein